MNMNSVSAQFLRSELRLRQERNPRYSLRAFAKKIGISPAYLSKVLTGKCILSVNAAQKVMERIPVNPEVAKRILFEADAHHLAKKFADVRVNHLDHCAY